MGASVIPETGGPEVVTVAEVPDPEIGPDDVLVEVEASTINHTDVWIRRGYEGDPPIVTGIDVAGVVREAGADVERFRAGDRVVLYWNTTYCGECEFCNDGETMMCPDNGGSGVQRDGGHAEYVAVEARHAVHLPDEVGFDEAAAGPSNFGTAWWGLVTCADVGPSDDVHVLGASGGVGHGTVRIAAHAGATVYAGCSSEEKAPRLRELGAHHVIDNTETDIDDAVAELTDRRGVDVVFESVGGGSYERAVRSLVRGGQLVTIGATTGDADQRMLQHVFWKQLEIISATRGEFEDMLGVFFDGDIETGVDSVVSLEEIPAAHVRLSKGESFEKIIVRPNA